MKGRSCCAVFPWSLLAAMFACALPAVAATDRIHVFSIPGVYGVRAWGSYYDTGERVQVTVCVEDTARSVYGAAVGLAFDSSYRHHDNVGAVTIGNDHTRCRSMLTFDLRGRARQSNLTPEAHRGHLPA
jgi:hypothetical protein